MPLVALICAVLVVATTLIHYEALRALNTGLPALRIAGRLKLVVVILGAFVAHAVEMLLYAIAFYGLVAWLGWSLARRCRVMRSWAWTRAPVMVRSRSSAGPSAGQVRPRRLSLRAVAIRCSRSVTGSVRAIVPSTTTQSCLPA